MTCTSCGTDRPDGFWRCPDCGELNRRRVVQWCGAILAPAGCFALGVFGSRVLELMGLPQKIEMGTWMCEFFPFAGAPFVWWGEDGWKNKVRCSLVYVVSCYGTAMFGMILLVTIFLGLSGRFCL